MEKSLFLLKYGQSFQIAIDKVEMLIYESANKDGRTYSLNGSSIKLCDMARTNKGR